MVDENGLKVLSCVFWDDVLCSFRKDARSGVMGRCFKCRDYRRFMREMEREEDEFGAEADRKKEGFRCYCDGKFCDNDVIAGCFAVESDNGVPTDILRWVCPRFDVNRVSGVMKEEFLRLRKREGGSV